MTAIAGVVHNGGVWIGGDAAGSNGWLTQIRKAPKVFRNGNMLFGYTDSFRMGQILEHNFTPPTKPSPRMPALTFMVKEFIPAIRETFKTHGYQRVEHSQESGGTFLVGYQGCLFEVQSDYQVAQMRQTYCAVGSGREVVLGSLHTTDAFDISPKERIAMALRAAEEYCEGVHGPFTIKHIG